MDGFFERAEMMGQDKLLHAFAGLMIVLLLSGFGVDTLSAFLIACIAGAAKELYDTFHTDEHTADLMDLVATVAGGAMGAGILAVVK